MLFLPKQQATRKRERRNLLNRRLIFLVASGFCTLVIICSPNIRKSNGHSNYRQQSVGQPLLIAAESTNTTKEVDYRKSYGKLGFSEPPLTPSGADADTNLFQEDQFVSL